MTLSRNELRNVATPCQGEGTQWLGTVWTPSTCISSQVFVQCSSVAVHSQMLVQDIHWHSWFPSVCLVMKDMSNEMTVSQSCYSYMPLVTEEGDEPPPPPPPPLPPPPHSYSSKHRHPSKIRVYNVPSTQSHPPVAPQDQRSAPPSPGLQRYQDPSLAVGLIWKTKKKSSDHFNLHGSIVRTVHNEGG